MSEASDPATEEDSGRLSDEPATSAVAKEAPEAGTRAGNPAQDIGVGTPILVGRSYRVPPDFLQQLGTGKMSFRAWLQKRGIQFPEGALAFYDPVRSIAVIRHREATADRIAKLIEPTVRNPQPQIHAETKLMYRRGEEVCQVQAPSVVTRSGQRAKVEIIQEVIYPREKEGEFEVIPVGLVWEIDPVVQKGLKVAVSGEVLVRVPKGENPAEFVDGIYGGQGAKQAGKKPEFDVYRSPYKQTIANRQAIELALEGVEDRRFLKRWRRPLGTLTAKLTFKLIDPKGQPIENERDLREAFPPFKMRPMPITATDIEQREKCTTVALAALDLGDHQLAERSAKTALALGPGDSERLALWQRASTSLQGKRARAAGTPHAWDDRSYRLRPPLLPRSCTAGGDEGRVALRRFLTACGTGFPAGATATLEGATLVVHNQWRELERLETALRGRTDILAGKGVTVNVETFAGVRELAGFAGWDPPEDPAFVRFPIYGVVGVFTDPQYQLLRKAAKKKGLRRKTSPERNLPPGRTVDALEGLGLKTSSCMLSAKVARNGLTIDVSLSPEQFETAEQRAKGLSLRKLSTAVTVWDGQWIALGNSNEDGSHDMIFIKVRIAKL